MDIITDLACELLRRTPNSTTGITLTTLEQAGITIQQTTVENSTAARQIGKPIGTYLNLDTTACKARNIIKALRHALQPLIPDTTKIIIAQRISSVQDCDKIIILDEGGINDIGNHEELLSRNEIYKDVYISQQEGKMEQ